MDSPTWLASDRDDLDQVAGSVVTWIDSAHDAARECRGHSPSRDPGSRTLAGLNLYLVRFDYDYGDRHIAARHPARVRITVHCENTGAFALPTRLPDVASRTALDLAPIDPTDADAAVLDVASRRHVARVVMEPVGGTGVQQIQTGLTHATSQPRASAHAHGR